MAAPEEMVKGTPPSGQNLKLCIRFFILLRKKSGQRSNCILVHRLQPVIQLKDQSLRRDDWKISEKKAWEESRGDTSQIR